MPKCEKCGGELKLDYVDDRPDGSKREWWYCPECRAVVIRTIDHHCLVKVERRQEPEVQIL